MSVLPSFHVLTFGRFCPLRLSEAAGTAVWQAKLAERESTRLPDRVLL
jgi:hypothetical protein